MRQKNVLSKEDILKGLVAHLKQNLGLEDEEAEKLNRSTRILKI